MWCIPISPVKLSSDSYSGSHGTEHVNHARCVLRSLKSIIDGIVADGSSNCNPKDISCRGASLGPT